MKKDEENQILGELNLLCLLFYDNAHFSKELPSLPNPDEVRECVDFLRIAIKYTLFDLEATKREGKK